jgi:hypothetical protein
VCLLDDAQWLDQASRHALEFAARRPSAEPLAVIFAVRHVVGEQPLGGLPELVVSGLANEEVKARFAHPGRLGRMQQLLRDSTKPPPPFWEPPSQGGRVARARSLPSPARPQE